MIQGTISTATAATAATYLQRADGSGRQPRVLVVDDTEDNLFLMTALLEDRYDVQLAGSGVEALIQLSQQTPDLILLDIMMPEMDGYEVLRRIRAHGGTADVPVIFLTALASPEEEQLGLDLGAVDYITKPISPPLLLARVQSHLERSLNAQRLTALSARLSRYLAPQVCQSLLDGAQHGEIRTQRKKLTVFFSDIEGFTESTAKWQPEEITELLNSYFTEMTRIATEFGGTIDKFIGDAIVIFFGDPASLGAREDALRCVRMAIAMQQAMGGLQARWRALGPGKTFRIRIGINTGFCDVGNFGCDLRMDYTIIGPEVNLAARLEQAAGPGGILISGATHALVHGDIDTGAAVQVDAKGFAAPVAAYPVLGESGADCAIRQVFLRELEGISERLDLDRLPSAERAVAALELREMANRLAA